MSEPHEATQRRDITALKAASDDALALVAAYRALEIRPGELRRILDRFGRFRLRARLFMMAITGA